MGLVETRQTVTKVEALMNRLPGVLMAAEGTVSQEEEAKYRAAMNAVCAPDMLPKFRADLSIYMEACKYCSQKWKSVGVVFLITEDYKTFVRSPTVERLLGETVKIVLNGDKVVAVKLAGKIIIPCK